MDDPRDISMIPRARRDRDEMTMPEPSPAFEARMSLEAIKGERTLTDLIQQFEGHSPPTGVCE